MPWKCGIADRLGSSGPVRIGNLAYHQVQNDVFGAAVLAGTHAFFDRRLERPPDGQVFGDLERLGEQAMRVFDTPDAGLWELRGSKRVHTFSSIMCWAACDRLAAIAKQLNLPERAAVWAAHAQTIHQVICTAAWNDELGGFASTFGGDRVDASLLLMAEVQFLAPDDARFAGTVNAIEARSGLAIFLSSGRGSRDKIRDYRFRASWATAAMSGARKASMCRIFGCRLNCETSILLSRRKVKDNFG